MMRKFTALATLLILLVAVGWWAAQNRFTVFNESGQPIRFLSVKIRGETTRFENILPGASVSALFGTPEDEDCFVVQGQLEDGTKFLNDCGYVVWENYGKRFGIAIRPGGEVSETR